VDVGVGWPRRAGPVFEYSSPAASTIQSCAAKRSNRKTSKRTDVGERASGSTDARRRSTTAPRMTYSRMTPTRESVVSTTRVASAAEMAGKPKEVKPDVAPQHGVGVADRHTANGHENGPSTAPRRRHPWKKGRTTSDAATRSLGNQRREIHTHATTLAVHEGM